jgi:hypothetical protein
MRSVAIKKESTQVKYYILVKYRNRIYTVGKIIIKRYDGDIQYIPSQRKIEHANFKIIESNLNKITWHKDGRTHYKMASGSYINVQYRPPIQNIGFQELVRETILDVKKLPVHKKVFNQLDVSFHIPDDYNGPIQFIFSAVSGRLIIAQHEKKKVPIRIVSEDVRRKIIDSEMRCLGNESGNADKLLQYYLIKYLASDTIGANRRIFIPDDSKISRDF